MNWAKDISSVEVMAGGMGSTPAMVGNNSGKMFLNVEKLQHLPEDEIISIIDHERGHILGKTRNEHKADGIGFKNYAKTGRSLKASYMPLLRFLPFNKPEHYQRLKNQVIRALVHDAKVNGNHKVYPIIQKLLLDGNNGTELKNVERI